MSDWEIVQDNNAGSAPAQVESEWEQVHQPAASVMPKENESLGKSVALAVPRVLEDVGRAAYKGFNAIPEYYNKATTEIPGLYSMAKKHPGHAAMQALAGSQEAINSLAQMPKELVQYGANRLNLLPEGAAKFMEKITPEDTTGAINQLFDQPKYPGEALLRGTVRNALPITGGAKIANYLNPLRYTDKGILNKVLKTEQNMKAKYSGPNGSYNKLTQEATSRGIDMSHFDPKKIDIDTIKKYTSPKHVEALETFLNDKNLTTAQKAISDLGYIERRLESKMTLLEPEKEQLKAVKNAKSYIQENMFKDKSGKVHGDLLEKHKGLQKGYATEVIPYTKNTALQAYKKGEKLPGEAVQSISRGKFAAKRGKFHPEIGRRKMFEKILKNPLSRGVGFGLGALGIGGLGKLGYDAYFGNEGSEK